MAVYAIGDIQGCWRTLEQLLKKIAWRPRQDQLWLLGDLVGRGPMSLDVLRFARAERHSVHCVLGNHDLALLAFAMGIGQPRPSDRLDTVLQASDADALIAHLRTQPLVAQSGGYVLLHAGALPSWSKNELLNRSEQASRLLQTSAAYGALQRFLQVSDAPLADHHQQQIDQSLRILTCLRTLDEHGDMHHGFKGPLSALPDCLTPWFRWPGRVLATTPIVCGHWAALGLHIEPNLYALDGGCVWGGSLCAMRLDDRVLFAADSAEGPGTSTDFKPVAGRPETL